MFKEPDIAGMKKFARMIGFGLVTMQLQALNTGVTDEEHGDRTYSGSVLRQMTWQVLESGTLQGEPITEKNYRRSQDSPRPVDMPMTFKMFKHS